MVYSGYCFDSNDQKILNVLGTACLRENITFPGYKFYGSQKMPVRPNDTKDAEAIQMYYRRHVKENIPVPDSAEMFGIHKSLDVRRNIDLAHDMLSNIKMCGMGSWVSLETERYEILEDEEQNSEIEEYNLETVEVSNTIRSLLLTLNGINVFLNISLQMASNHSPDSNRSEYICLPLLIWLRKKLM